jgi:hypothetical protein
LSYELKAIDKTQNHKTKQVFLKTTCTLILILKANLLKSFNKFDSYRWELSGLLLLGVIKNINVNFK